MRIHPLKRPPALPILLVAMLAASSFVSTASAQDNPDLAAAREIVAMQDAAECLALIDDFLKSYPDSRYIADILQTGVARAIELDGSSRLALDYAERYIQNAQASGDAATLANSLNNMAWTLYEGRAHLARAEEYAARALAVLPESRRTMSLKASTLDTQAHVAGALGKYEQAIASQKAAVEIDPRNAAYKGTLGTFYMEAGMVDEAESYLVEAILNAPADETVRSAFEMLVKARGASDPTEYKTRLLGESAHETLMASDDPKALSMNLARAFVELGVLPERAFAYAELAVATSPAEKGAGDYLQARMTMAAWQFEHGDIDQALDLMSDLTRIASPYDTEFHLLYGGALQKAGRDRDAIEAYMLPLAAYPNNLPLRQALEPLWEKVYGPEENLDEALEQRALGLENWHPTEHFKAPDSWEGRVALAELFTGSECPPCVASDLAFDGLLEHYPTDVLAIGMLHAAQRRGLEVPRDVSITGFDDIPFAAVSVPALTTVRMPTEAIMVRAIDLAIGSTDVGADPHPVLEPELVIRASTGPARDLAQHRI